MKRIPENVINDIRQKSDIVDTVSSYLTLTKKGKNYMGVCPFHDDHDPSMTVSPDRQIYKCFVCGAGGNVFTFLQNIEGISFTDAVLKQGERVDVDVSAYASIADVEVSAERKRAYDLMEAVASFTQYTLYSKDGEVGLNILRDRGYSDALIKHFGIGVALDGNKIHSFLKAKGFQDDEMLANDVIRLNDTIQDVFYNRIMFPIADAYGKPIAFSARTLDPKGTVKYINTSETELYTKGNTIYNYHNAKDIGRKNSQIIICEGVTDVMAFYGAGYMNAVALLGIACTDTQMRLLRSVTKNILLAFDGDKAGYEATYNIGSKLVSSGFNVSVWYNDTGRDPDEVLKLHGAKRIEEGVNHPLGWFDFIMTYAMGLYGLNSFEDKKRVVKMVAGHLADAEPLTRNYYLKQLSEKTGFDSQVIETQITENHSKKPRYDYDLQPAIHSFKVVKAERELLKQMLLSKDAAYLYRDGLGFFPDPLAQELALILLDMYRTHEVISIADLFSIGLSETLSQFLSSLIEDTTVDTYRTEIVEASIDRIKSLVVEDNIKQIRQEIGSKSLKEQMKLLEQATISKRKAKGGVKQ